MRIQKIVLSSIIAILSISCSGQQNLVIQISDNTELIKALNSSQLISENSEPYIAALIYKIDNGTGSAGFPNSEVSHNLLVAISEFGEEPPQNLFEIGPFYNPKFISWQVDQENEKEFVIEYGPHDKRQSLRLGVNMQRLWIID